MFLLISLASAAVIGSSGLWYIMYFFKKKEKQLDVKQKALLISSTSVLLIALSLFFGLAARPVDWTMLSFTRTVIAVYSLAIFSPIDFSFKIIPNKLVLVLLIISIVLCGAEFFIYPSMGFYLFMDHFIGAVIGGGIFMLGRVLSKSGMGMGDVKLMAVIGLLLGLESVLALELWAMLFAALFGVVLMLIKKAKSKSTLPLAPFFFIGSVLMNVMFMITGLLDG